MEEPEWLSHGWTVNFTCGLDGTILKWPEAKEPCKKNDVVSMIIKLLLAVYGVRISQ
jgi:hypothetical protein